VWKDFFSTFALPKRVDGNESERRGKEFFKGVIESELI
jgi:hypothetical protein